MLEAPEMSAVIDQEAHDLFIEELSVAVSSVCAWCTLLSSARETQDEVILGWRVDMIVDLFHRAYGGSGLAAALVTPEELGLDIPGDPAVKSQLMAALRECRRFGVYALHVASSGENVRSLTMALQLFNAFLVYCSSNN